MQPVPHLRRFVKRVAAYAGGGRRLPRSSMGRAGDRGDDGVAMYHAMTSSDLGVASVARFDRVPCA